MRGTASESRVGAGRPVGTWLVSALLVVLGTGGCGLIGGSDADAWEEASESQPVQVRLLEAGAAPLTKLRYRPRQGDEAVLTWSIASEGSMSLDGPMPDLDISDSYGLDLEGE